MNHSERPRGSRIGMRLWRRASARAFLPLATLLPFAVLALRAGRPPLRTLTDAATPNISPQRIQADINYLASPKLKGRDTGTPENNRAAKYIAQEFRRAGLEPLSGDNGSFFQYFSVTVGAELGKNNRALVHSGGLRNEMHLKDDWLPFNYSEGGEAAVPLVFAGFGITAPEYHYDDYAHLDAKDKAVIVLRNEPQKDDEKSIFDGRQPTQYSALINKAINARNMARA